MSRDEAPLEVTPEFEAVLEAVESGRSPIFVTGVAGTGKSRLLRLVRTRACQKNVAVVAPTGVAALNVDGMTIHSFFALPPITQVAESFRPEYRLIPMMRSLDLLIVDEVSMARADLIEAMNIALRFYRRNQKPFGGLQLLLFGDALQLPPIVRDQEEAYFQSVFESAFFFDAPVLRSTRLHRFDLTKIFRQESADFIELLNAVRVGDIDQDVLDRLNERVVQKEGDKDALTLTTTNALATEVNARAFSDLLPPECSWDASVTGFFPEHVEPAPRRLTLRKGTRVMLVKNVDAHRVNGSLGVVQGWQENGERAVSVIFDGDSEPFLVTEVRWDAHRFVHDRATGTLQQPVVGSYTQMPLKLAWAATIHKSQGLTLDRVNIETGGRIFAPGQLYVALSRCRSLEGIRLLTPLTLSDVQVHERAVAFLDGDHAPALQQETDDGHHATVDEEAFREMISNAISARGTIRMGYRAGNGRATQREVEPVEWLDGDRFRARCRLRDDDRTFRLSRVTAIGNAG